MLTLAACASAQRPVPSVPSARPPAARRVVPGGEFVVVGRPDGQGEVFDDQLLFDRATNAVQTHRCAEALTDYDALLAHFPSSRYLQATQYNRGVCLHGMGRLDDAISAFRAAAERPTERSLVRDALFRLAVIGEATSRTDLVFETMDAVLADSAATLPERVEASAREATAHLARREYDLAVTSANATVALAPTADSVNALEDDTYAAQARFVLADVSRQRAAGVAIRVNDPELDRAIERRVGLVVHAHVQYNEAIRVGNPHWAAACGFSIGEMYRSLYDAIVGAPVPTDWDAHAVEIYRQRTARRLRPLLQGALRAWEATLDMAQRNGISDNDWARRTSAQIGSLRELVLGAIPAGGSSAPPTGR